jgi:hypothetical protein
MVICDSCGEHTISQPGELCPECQPNPDALTQLCAVPMPVLIVATWPARPEASRLPLVDRLLQQANSLRYHNGYLQRKLGEWEALAWQRLKRIEELGRELARVRRDNDILRSAAARLLHPQPQQPRG